MTSIDRQHAFSRSVLFREPHPASRDDTARYFGPFRMPGTAVIGARKNHPELFQDTLDSELEPYPEWLDRQLTRTASAVMARQNRPNHSVTVEKIVSSLTEMLEYRAPEGIPLCNAIPQQIYEDVFVRMSAEFTAGKNPFQEIHLYRELNAVCHRLGLAMIACMENRGMTDPTPENILNLIQTAVFSGAIGINLKSSASAASTLLNRDMAPIPPAWTTSMEAAAGVSASDLHDMAASVLAMIGLPEARFELESLSDYHREVLIPADPTLLVFFCDDYLESMIDMKRFEAMAGRNPLLTVLFVPRNGRYGNDLSVEDLRNLLQEPHFREFKRLMARRRIIVSDAGPRAGCIDFRDVNPSLIRQMDTLGKNRKVIFETKGCRNFEMLQGMLPVPWYASFNCNRALSIRTVGVDGPPVFLRIPPGLRAYDGFHHPRIGRSPSYGISGVRFCRMTTRQLYTALETRVYADLKRRMNDEYTRNTALTRIGQDREATVAELLEGNDDLIPFLKLREEV